MIDTLTFDQLGAGDRIVAIDGSVLATPHVVEVDLRRADGAVLLVHPNPDAGIEWALYPEQGRDFHVERDEPAASEPAPVVALPEPSPVCLRVVEPMNVAAERWGVRVARPGAPLTDVQKFELRAAYARGGLLREETHGSAINALIGRKLVGEAEGTFRRHGVLRDHHRLTAAGAAWCEHDAQRKV